MSKSASSLLTKSAGANLLPVGVAPDLEEILERCAQIEAEGVTGKVAKLVREISQIAEDAAESIKASFEGVA